MLTSNFRIKLFKKMYASFELCPILKKEQDNLSSLIYMAEHFSPQGGSPPGESTSPEAHIPTGSTGCWIGTGCTPGPSHLFGRCGSPPMEPGIHCWWCPQYPSPGCCLDPASRRRPGAPSAATADTMAKLGQRIVEHSIIVSTTSDQKESLVSQLWCIC